MDIGDQCDWIPKDARERIMQYYPDYCTKYNEVVLFSEKYRTQQQNLKDALEKMQSVVDEALIPPKIRKFREKKKQNAEQKAQRVDFKRKRSQITSRRSAKWE